MLRAKPMAVKTLRLYRSGMRPVASSRWEVAAIRALWNKLRPSPAPPSSTGSELVYAVGDVHGRADLLKALVATIFADALQLIGLGEPSGGLG